MERRTDRTDLHQKIDPLTDGQAKVVAGFVDAVLAPLHSEELPATWLTVPAWSDAFLARLRGHHGLSQEPLSTTQFEAAFNESCLAAGWQVEVSASATQRFFDTTITVTGGQPQRLSLKASSAKDMSIRSVHISKLTEAAWIQDVRRKTDRRDHIVTLFRDYQSVTSAIVMLRGFRDRAGCAVYYELLEIPTTIFGPVSALGVDQAQLGTIRIPDVKVPDFAIRVDRSDAKITVTSIRLDLCIIHGRWGVSASGRST